MKKGKWILCLGGVLLILSSFFIFQRPIANLVTMAFVLSFIMLFNGVSEIILYFTEKKENKKTWTLINGILTVLIAIWLLTSSFVEMTLVLPTIFAFWIMMSGTIRLVTGIHVKETLLTILGIIGIILGFILLYHPLFSGLMISYMVAGTFLYQGIVAIVSAFSTKEK